MHPIYMYQEPIVDDALLRKLAAEMRNMYRQVEVKQTGKQSAYNATIINVIIIPYSDFYRNQFLNFYRSNHFNAVKALKELRSRFPYTPDYVLDIGYVISIRPQQLVLPGFNEIKNRDEFEIL